MLFAGLHVWLSRLFCACIYPHTVLEMRTILDCSKECGGKYKLHKSGPPAHEKSLSQLFQRAEKGTENSYCAHVTRQVCLKQYETEKLNFMWRPGVVDQCCSAAMTPGMHLMWTLASLLTSRALTWRLSHVRQESCCPSRLCFMFCRFRPALRSFLLGVSSAELL